MTAHDSHEEETTRQGTASAPTGGPVRTREPEPAPKPSQAEGDRETIEEDLRDKEAAGEL
jgi:hypothetical protein